MTIMIDGPSGVAFAQAAARKAALRLEVETGLKYSRGSVLALCKRDYGVRSNTKKGALAEMEMIVEGWLGARTGQWARPKGGVVAREAYRHGMELYFHHLWGGLQLQTFNATGDLVRPYHGRTIDSTMFVEPWIKGTDAYDFNEVGPMYRVWLDDGSVMLPYTVWPEEIFPCERAPGQKGGRQ